MRRFRDLAIAAAVLTSALTSPVAARVQYHTAFKKTYETSRSKLVEKKCTVCHGAVGTDKRVRNDYGKAFGKALGATNVKDEKKIQAALQEVESHLPGDDESSHRAGGHD